jgi:anti-sigma factor RsiW
MNCQDAQHLLSAYADGELDLVHSLQVEEHLGSCPGCAQAEKNLRSLQTALAVPSLRYAAPAALRARIQAAQDEAPTALADAPVIANREAWLRHVALAAGFLVMIGVGATLGILLSRGRTANGRVEDWVVAGHVRSLQVNHLTDVVSSDRHTVKPWFRDKLDFSPLVPDLAADGFPLSGGRLDYLDGRPVAALVYQRGKHAINVFTWPAEAAGDRPLRESSRQGFHLREWQQAGMNYWAISDLNDEDLDQFVRLFQQRTTESHP